MGTAQCIKNLVTIIPDNELVVVVLSAMSGTTNSLVEISELLRDGKPQNAMHLLKELEIKYYQTVNELFSSNIFIKRGSEFINDLFSGVIKKFTEVLSPNDINEVIALGELLSSGLFHLYLNEQGKRSAYIPALNFMRIDKDREPDYYYITENFKRYLNSYPKTSLFITQGFICRNALGETDNLGRGGSDYTAAIIGNAMDANQVEIWTDIDGIHNNDPRYVDNTIPLRHLSFDEAAELAYFGAKILHPSTINPCSQKSIPVILKNTLKPEDKGTIISSNLSFGGIKAIAAKDGITAIKVRSSRMLMAYGFLARVFEIFNEFRTPVDLITTSEVSVSLTIDNDSNLNRIVEKLTAFSSVEVEKDQTIICVVGDFAASRPGLASKIFEALEMIPIKMISYGGSTHNVSILVDFKNKVNALRALHQLVCTNKEANILS